MNEVQNPYYSKKYCNIKILHNKYKYCIEIASKIKVHIKQKTV